MAKKQPGATPTLPGIQPRSVTTEATRDTYRASVQAELQKFPREKPPFQLPLQYSQQQLEWSGSVNYGLTDLSSLGIKAMAAVQIILDKTDYEGNQPGGLVDSKEYKGIVRVIKHRFTPKEYLLACGLPPSRHHGHQAELLIKALFEELTKPRFICYKGHRAYGQPPELIATMRPLMAVNKVYQNSTPEEEARIKAGEEISKRLRWIEVEVTGVMLEGFDSPTGTADFYFFKPITQYRELEQIAGGKVHPSVFLFTDALLLTSLNPYRLGKKLLAKKIGLSRLVKQRKTSELDARIQEAIRLATSANPPYLLGHSVERGIDGLPVYVFHLNPERCTSVKQKKAEAEDEEDSH